MSALEELWNGNLRPVEDALSAEAHDAMTSITKATKKLTASLSPEQNNQMDIISALRTKQLDIIKRDAFAAGFRLAMRLMMDSLPKQES